MNLVQNLLKYNINYKLHIIQPVECLVSCSYKIYNEYGINNGTSCLSFGALGTNIQPFGEFHWILSKRKTPMKIAKTDESPSLSRSPYQWHLRWYIIT